MADWQYVVKGVRRLIQDFDPDTDDSAKNVQDVHAVLARHSCFDEFEEMDDMACFRGSCKEMNLSPEETMDFANELFRLMYDFADSELIWLEL